MGAPRQPASSRGPTMGKKKQEEHVIKEATVDTDLWRTAMFGMNDSLRKIVEDASAGSDESGVVFDINAKDASGATPLIYAARAGHVETIQYLVDNGGDVSEAGYGGLLPLHHAINHMREPTCTLLLDLDANPNAGDEHGATALHFAAMAGALNARRPGARVGARAGRGVVPLGARAAHRKERGRQRGDEDGHGAPPRRRADGRRRHRREAHRARRPRRLRGVRPRLGRATVSGRATAPLGRGGGRATSDGFFFVFQR